MPLRAYSDFVGIPFVPKGRDFNGCDCWGLVRLVYLHRKYIQLPSYDEFYRDINDEANEIANIIQAEASGEHWRRIEKPVPDCVAHIRLKGVPFHLAIVIDNKYALHAIDGVNSCLIEYRSHIWKNRVLGFYEYVAN